MNDLIYRQDAIDALNNEYHGMLSDESMKIYQIKNWLAGLPSAEPQWIPVSERLPETEKAFSDGGSIRYDENGNIEVEGFYTAYTSDPVIIYGKVDDYYYERDYGMYIAVFHRFVEEDGETETAWYDCVDGEYQFKAVAWMPLPPPYEGV